MRIAEIILASALIGTGASPHAAEIRKGTLELSGTASFAAAFMSDGDEYTWRISPGLSIYPGKYVFLGPVFYYTRVSRLYLPRLGEDYTVKTSIGDVGGHVGYLANYSTSPYVPLPYLAAAGGLSLSSIQVEGEDQVAGNGFFCSLRLGAKIPITGSFLLDIAPEYIFRSLNSDMHVFMVAAGFSGIF